MRIYIAGPISRGNLADNINQATEAFVRLAKLGYSPMCPHWNAYANECDRVYIAGPIGTVDNERCRGYGTTAGNSQLAHADWLRIDLEWVSVSDAVLRLPGESLGADQEAMHARQKGIPVFHSIEELERYANPWTGQSKRAD